MSLNHFYSNSNISIIFQTNRQDGNVYFVYKGKKIIAELYIKFGFIDEGQIHIFKEVENCSNEICQTIKKDLLENGFKTILIFTYSELIGNEFLKVNNNLYIWKIKEGEKNDISI